MAWVVSALTAEHGPGPPARRRELRSNPSPLRPRRDLRTHFVDSVAGDHSGERSFDGLILPPTGEPRRRFILHDAGETRPRSTGAARPVPPSTLCVEKGAKLGYRRLILDLETERSESKIASMRYGVSSLIHAIRTRVFGVLWIRLGVRLGTLDHEGMTILAETEFTNSYSIGRSNLRLVSLAHAKDWSEINAATRRREIEPLAGRHGRRDAQSKCARRGDCGLAEERAIVDRRVSKDGRGKAAMPHWFNAFAQALRTPDSAANAPHGSRAGCES
ncbi:hypothetical protein SAMN05446934_9924 [Paraburkholderia hospita]|nr:hypothetical protein SAMN05446934_9924 [Paraburkholderia hospita]